jgi:hypothetical protein
LLVHAASVLNVQVSKESVQDLERVDRLAASRSTAGWNQEAMNELLRRLDEEAWVQCAAIRYAAGMDGFVDRLAVYELGDYDEERTLRGFTRPVRRIVQDLRDRGSISSDAVDVLEAVYDPQISSVQACGFRLPTGLIPLVVAAGPA